MKAQCHAQLKQIDGSKQMWATQEKRADGDTPSEVGRSVNTCRDGMPILSG